MPPSLDMSAIKVLVIDDQEFVRTIIKKMLQQMGITAITEAQDGNSGLETAEKTPPDVVICDVQMRPVDGFGFVRSLRAKPFGADLPVIMLTAHTDAATLNRARELKVNAFLAKPVLPPALRDKISAVIGGTAPPL